MAWNEVLFQNRLRDIQMGKAEPLAASIWHNQLTGLKSIRSVKSQTEKLLQNFLKSIQ
jgi:hypothetical protein